MKKRSLNGLQERQNEQDTGRAVVRVHLSLSDDGLWGGDQLPENGHPGAYLWFNR